ncbi:MAG: ATP-binding protein [Chloroflexi bacterium]|nr:ATP-binding protein [Chloroflexota bacterium]
MEELGDILKKLGQPGRSALSGDLPPPEDDEPGDQCPRCGGRGWYTLDVPVGNPDFGRAITCECQTERMDEGRAARLLRYSNLGALTRYTFDSFDLERLEDLDERKLLGETVETAEAYAENPHGWLVLIGPHGAGKTHLAAAIANQRIKAGHLALFVHVSDLMDHLRSSFSPNSDVSYTDLFEQVQNAPLMVLDGLGNQNTSPWALEKLRQIVNYRFNAELPTVFTTASELRNSIRISRAGWR